MIMILGRRGTRTQNILHYRICTLQEHKSRQSNSVQTTRKIHPGERPKTNPKTMFHEDLLAVLQRWQEKGDRLVLIMDMNTHIIDSAMCKQMAGDDLQMREVVHSETE